MEHVPYPKVVALDTDFTLFHGRLDHKLIGKGWGSVCPVQDNLELENDWTVRDKTDHDQKFYLYKDIPKIINHILSSGAEIAVVSQSDSKVLVDRTLWYFKAADKYGKQTPIINLVKYEEVYDESKVVHLQKIHEWSKIAYADMILFDDEAVNNNVRHELGVTFQVCRGTQGITWERYQHGIDMWRRAKVIRSCYLGQDQRLYKNMGPTSIGYTGVDAGTLELLTQGKTRLDTQESARWGYATYITDNPAIASFFAEWIKRDTFGPHAQTFVCEIWVRDWSLWEQVSKIWYPEKFTHTTDNKHWNANKIAWRQEDRDGWIEALGVLSPYVLFCRHHYMDGMPIPYRQRFNEMVVYRQVQDALLLTLPLTTEQLDQKIRGGYTPYHERIQSWNIVVPREAEDDCRTHGEGSLLLRN